MSAHLENVLTIPTVDNGFDAGLDSILTGLMGLGFDEGRINVNLDALHECLRFRFRLDGRHGWRRARGTSLRSGAGFARFYRRLIIPRPVH